MLPINLKAPSFFKEGALNSLGRPWPHSDELGCHTFEFAEVLGKQPGKPSGHLVILLRISPCIARL